MVELAGEFALFEGNQCEGPIDCILDIELTEPGKISLLLWWWQMLVEQAPADSKVASYVYFILSW